MDIDPVIFLIWMAPIIEKIEQRLKEEVGRVGRMQNEIDVELPSFVDNMLIDMIDWEGGANMQMIETNAKKIIREVEKQRRRRYSTYKRAGGRRAWTVDTSSGLGSSSMIPWTLTYIGRPGS